jgi:hypothetical protein
MAMCESASTAWGLYFQDEYRVTPNLKLTLALRGDRNSNPICATDCYSRFETAFSGMTHDVNTPYNQAIMAGTHSAFPDIEKVALQPRFGFTWSPLGHTNTVLRGGIGVFSDLYQGVLMDELLENSPLTNIFVVKPTANAAGFGAPLAPLAPGSIQALANNSNTSFVNAFAGGGTLGLDFGEQSVLHPARHTPRLPTNSAIRSTWNGTSRSSRPLAPKCL